MFYILSKSFFRKVQFISSFLFIYIILLLNINIVIAQNDSSNISTPIPKYLTFDDNFTKLMEAINDSALNNLYFTDDSLANFFPIIPMFENWDTNGLFKYKADFSHKCDTTILVLTYNSAYGYVHPVNSTKITSTFGWRRRRYHYGIDIGLNVGDTIKSAFDGVVRITQYHRGYGNIIVVRHFNGLETTYAHLSKILVTQNQTVTAGTTIGLGGSTGRSTGPHLHFELRYKGAAFNPFDVIDFEKQKLISDTLILTSANFNYSRMHSTRGAVNPGANSRNNNTQSSSKYYTVRKGDTLGAIALRNHTTVSKLCKLNGIKSTTILKIGKKLKIR